MYLEKQCQVKKEEIHKMSVPIQWSGKGVAELYGEQNFQF